MAATQKQTAPRKRLAESVIFERCARIRSTWTPRERQLRAQEAAVRMANLWAIATGHVPTARLANAERDVLSFGQARAQA